MSANDEQAAKRSTDVRGRPPKPPSETRSERKTVRFTTAELECVEQRAERTGMSVAGFLRAAALGKHIEGGAERESRRAVLTRLTRIGNLLHRLERNGEPVPAKTHVALAEAINLVG